LYTYKKYTDVRLVFAPEFQIAFFGGDPDNFEFPRYDLDVAYFRAYENGAPVHSEYFKWSANGAKDGELVFVPGNPGATDRLSTVAELELLRDVEYPYRRRVLDAQRAALEAYAAKGEEQARQQQRRYFSVMNNVKRMKGYLGGLEDAKLMAKKTAEEKALRERGRGTEAGMGDDGKPWRDIEAVEARWKPSVVRYGLLETYNSGAELLTMAQHLVRLATEKQLPNEKRLKEYRETALPSLELRLYSPAPIYDGLEETLLTSWLEVEQKELGASDPYVQKLLAGKTPAARAHELVAGTKLKDIAVRRSYGAASKAAIDASKDPLIVLARTIDGDRRAIRKQFEDGVEAPLHHAHELIAKAQFAEEGMARYPDATFTLRLSYGKVAGYTQAGKKVPSMTTIAGMYARAAKADGKAPWDVPPKWVAAKAKVDGKVPMDFVSTNDIIGGNSGSPVINAKGEIVGLIFDGNIQSLPGNFVYDDAQNRAVSVHSSALIEALRNVYDAGFLADELSPPKSERLGKKRASR
ncbi:MAG TPA: S46 family peptidase, partial [Polyangia bacterium]|nr:S46 family peptidase [Polyangia bacterium]